MSRLDHPHTSQNFESLSRARSYRNACARGGLQLKSDDIGAVRNWKHARNWRVQTPALDCREGGGGRLRAGLSKSRGLRGTRGAGSHSTRREARCASTRWAGAFARAAAATAAAGSLNLSLNWPPGVGKRQFDIWCLAESKVCLPK